MKKFWRMALVTMLVGGLMFAAVGCGGGDDTTGEGDKKEETITIKFSHVTSPDSPKGEAANEFKRLMEERTDNRVKVEVYPSSQLYGDKEEVEALQAGNVHIIAPTAAKMVGFVPAFQVFDLPFLFKDNASTYAAMDGEVGTKLFGMLEPQGLKGLGFWANGFKQMSNSKEMIKTTDDTKGLKFRTMAGAVLEAQFKALGASGATIPFGETYAALQQGTVDAQENTWNNSETQKFYEVQKYFTESNHGRLDYVVLTNTEWFNNLPEDIRTILVDTMKEVTAFERVKAEELDAYSRKVIDDSPKAEIYKLTDAEREAFRTAMTPVWAEFEDVIGKDLIDACAK